MVNYFMRGLMMPSDDFIREQLQEIEINKCDAIISSMPTKEKRIFNNALSSHFVKATKTGEYKKEFEEMLKKYETFILQDEIQSVNITNAVVKCSKQLEDSIL